MGRGVSAGGGQSSLGYLFGSGEAPKPAVNNAPAETQPAPTPPPPSPAQPKTEAPKPVDVTKQGPAGLNSNSANNYMRADGQNTGNFLTDRPSTKVHSAPGGGSSLDYLFGGGPGGSN
ncbi:hypothetical protein EUTSA_v10019332mg [Eutrema salsugineum]|uniref:Protein SPIRAL1-like 1 n=2 Tax=Eutrema TaxID=98005 RepID=V4KES7_EUTSA|nr:protein SPIRAL1-like 2 [Eutrema salsugineum]ESQ28327.1 hypothetical protein EUTSA_v10019332mg [Eutrema salsugineum]BAJ33884.1 unnamed protein product [Eutrema halophilum]